MLIARCQPHIVVTKSYRYRMQPTDLATFWHTLFDLISVLFAYVILGQKNRPN